MVGGSTEVGYLTSAASHLAHGVLGWTTTTFAQIVPLQELARTSILL